MFKVPEKYRITQHSKLGSDASFGNNGAFRIPIKSDKTAFCIASDGMGWEHVSVTIEKSDGKIITPSWNDMALIKGLFWSNEDTVLQYHPPISQYVNIHPHCLHLWRPIGLIVELQPMALV